MKARTLAQLKTQREIAQRQKESRETGELFRSFAEIVRSFDTPITHGQSYNYASLQYALERHMIGNFAESGKIADMMLADDMISGTLESRYVMVASLLTDDQSLEIKPAKMGGATAKEVCEWWQDRFLKILDSSVLESMIRDSTMMSFSLHQIRYDGEGGWDLPVLERWHPSLTYYQQSTRDLMAIATGGTEAVHPYGGKWCLFSPFAQYLGWVQAGVRKLGMYWLIKAFCMRDWSRYATVYGNLIKLLKHPAKISVAEKQAAMDAIKNLHSEPIMPIPQGDGQGRSWDMTLLAPPTGSADVFKNLIEMCDQNITQYILGQDATTNMKGGAYNAVGVAFAGLTLGKARRDVVALNDRLFPQLVGSVTRTLFGSDQLAPIVRLKSNKIDYTIGDTGGPQQSSAQTEAPKPMPSGPQKQGKEAPSFGNPSNRLHSTYPKMQHTDEGTNEN